MVKKGIHHHILATFCLWVLFIDAKKCFCVRKNMEFSLWVGGMSFFVFCKFEVVVFNMVQVMTENIPFEFLYVLSILTKRTSR